MKLSLIFLFLSCGNLFYPGLCLSAENLKPNILFILTDDQRWDSLGCYGNEDIRTPFIDKLAAQGARLDAFYVASPLCCPSRGTFLSGFFPHQSGIETNSRRDFIKGSKTVASLLNGTGYITGFVGKAHLSGEPKRWGFQECPVYLREGESDYQDPTLVLNGKEQIVPGYITRIFADSAIRFLESHQKDRWFLWLALTAPHGPYTPIKDFYKDMKINPPPGWPKQQPLAKAKWPQYYSAISKADTEVGRVLSKLDELGIAKNTFVFFTSDNGYMWGSHGHKQKSIWYEEATRVPAIVRFPGKVKAGSTIASLASSSDFFPTILDIAQVPPEKNLEGVSLLPLLIQGTPVRKFVFSELTGRPNWQMVRSEKWKYVFVQEKRKKAGPFEQHLLYDMKNDSNEQKDLSSAPANAKILLEMKKVLADWIKKTDTSARKLTEDFKKKT